VEIEKLETRLAEKNAKVDVLEGQLEMLRRQVVRSKSASQRSMNNLGGKADYTQDSETQTDDFLVNGGPSSLAEEGRTTRQSCCVLM